MRLSRSVVLFIGLCFALPSGRAHAKKKPVRAAPGAPTAEQQRSLADLGGKFKWGMSHEEVEKVLEATIQGRYKDLIEKEKDLNKQDDLRRKELEDIQKAKTSYTEFDGKRAGWDVSIIDKEFQQKNSESMAVMWESNQRRFLFFWNDKLYKQFIAFDSAHPVFKDKSFDDFVKLLEARYGASQMRFSQMRTKDEQVVDHIEWPARGDNQLWAIDQSAFYGNYCLRLFSPKVQADLDKEHAEHGPKRGSGNALIDAVTRPDSVSGDKNADVVDEVLGKKSQRTNQGGDGTAPKSQKNDQKNEKKGGDPTEGLTL